MRFLLPLILLSGIGTLMLAQAPSPSDLNSPAHETIRLRLINSYQRALLTQQAAAAAQSQFDVARDSYVKLADDVAAELHLAKGTQFQIDIGAGTIKVVAPPAEPASKPAPPAEKKP